MTAFRIFALVGGFLAGLAASLVISPTSSQGSVLPPGAAWTYDVAGAEEMCRPVPARFVRKVIRGYEVRVLPTMHPMVQDGQQVSAFILDSEGRVRLSGDQRFHACINGAGVVFALYVPEYE